MTEGPPLARLVRDPQIVFDTMIPVHWAMAGHGSLLRYAFRGRAFIPGRVYREIDGHSHSPERARAGEMLRPTCFARSVEIPQANWPQVIRRMEGWTSIERVAQLPKENRGESEAIQLCVDAGNLPFVTQDHHGGMTAAAEGLDVFTSIDLLYALVITGLVSDCATAWGIYASLEATGLWKVPDYPYDIDGQRKFLARTADVEAVGVKWRAKHP